MYIELMLREGLEKVSIHVDDILSYNRPEHHTCTTISGIHLGTEQVIDSVEAIRRKIQEARGIEVTCTHDFESTGTKHFIVCKKCTLVEDVGPDSESMIAMTYEHTVRSIT